MPVLSKTKISPCGIGIRISAAARRLATVEIKTDSRRTDMIKFQTTYTQYENDLMELVRAFDQNMSGTDELSVCLDGVWVGKNELRAELTTDKFQNFRKIYRFNVTDSELHYEGSMLGGSEETVRKRLEKRYLKIALYRTLQFLTDVSLPYGALTGIRPTKLYFDLQNTGDVDRIFHEDFSVSGEKLSLIKTICETQTPLRSSDANEVDVFLNIPFCPTRCAYCSFVSVPIEKHKKLLESYKKCLISELSIIKNAIFENSFKVRSVYIGGGTPTSLPLAMLKEILSACDFDVPEFTVEAGRPDTLTPAVARALAEAGVTRISVNPQTFNQKTLDLIGRAHTVQDVLRAYRLAKKYFSVNMDLIAMLPGESLDDFKSSVDKAAALSPDNITVHTLAVKRGSALHEAHFELPDGKTAAEMVEYARKTVMDAGYLPYYMYRQKNVAGNLENVGYAKPGTACLYNVDIMEETNSILACGAGAISKKVFPDEFRIERLPNFKGVPDYIDRFDEIAEKSREFWSK